MPEVRSKGRQGDLLPKMPEYNYYLVTAFAREPFSGNPALIVFLDPSQHDLPSDKTCAEIAATFNQPIACFVSVPTLPIITATGPDTIFNARIRFWTPGFIEPAICGHGTLAATYVLLEKLRRLADIVTIPNIFNFETRSCGTISARHVRSVSDTDASTNDSNDVHDRIEIELPLYTPVPASDADAERLSAVLTRAVQRTIVSKADGTDRTESSSRRAVKVRNVIVAEDASTDEHAQVLYLIEVDEAEDIENMDLDRATFAESAPFRVNIITSRVTNVNDESGYDYKYRMFAPCAQIPEDHVCGSANCLLGPYWAAKLGRTELKARSASRRGGDVWVGVDRVAGKVRVRGEAALVSEGKIYAP